MLRTLKVRRSPASARVVSITIPHTNSIDVLRVIAEATVHGMVYSMEGKDADDISMTIFSRYHWIHS